MRSHCSGRRSFRGNPLASVHVLKSEFLARCTATEFQPCFKVFCPHRKEVGFIDTSIFLKNVILLMKFSYEDHLEKKVFVRC